ncbi:MAG: hypothetical protein ACUVXA_15170 [Candidatus Jordarchaeum sp.]|uniref:hypothetical protein n=1 Tax=Candidatus Jordarchaeum sp. TaxID=2823881 RepID=UPI00404A3FCC
MLIKGKETFTKLSRDFAKEVQKRESVTIRPKEELERAKARLTIENYLGTTTFSPMMR